MNKDRFMTIFATTVLTIIIWLIGAFTLDILRSQGILITGTIIEFIFGAGIVFTICYIWAAISSIIKGVANAE